MQTALAKIPTVRFDIFADKSPVSAYALRSDADIKRLDGLVRIPYDKLKVREGHNLRTEFGDLDELAASIEEIGQQDAIRVDVLPSGEAVISSGERRYRAIGILRGKNKELREKFATVKCLINEVALSEKDRIVRELTSNSGKPFEAWEEAEGFRKLRDDQKLSLGDIARLTGRSKAHVEQRLLLIAASAEEKKAVKSGAISTTALVATIRKEKDAGKRVTKIKTATGKVRVKDAKAQAKKVQPNKIAALVVDSLKILDELAATAIGKKMKDYTLALGTNLRKIKKEAAR